ncbi:MULTISPECIES: ribbon-helix-helix domain-containing protein [Niallia]|uniref:ribbon-helix-helix domain-containing protein n=1 Tax=Bacillaceae TaxID=186817 RepID=UPI0020415A72|nr:MULTISPECIES: ribbon-helix-helix domain-containing protein [Niallia]MCM3032875.1 ribbon-helix-helix domain-containing protein [Niallia sp. MER 6]MDK8643844.1 ribbon-helix-helix domain-containing protein [Niallia taxi]
MKEKTTISFEPSVLREIDKIVKQRGKNATRSEVVNEFCKAYLQIHNANEVEKVYAPIINKFMDENFKSFENRIASLLAKTSLDSAMSMFLLLDSISRSRNIQTNDLYQKTRGMAVKHVQNREDLMSMIDNKMKENNKN